MRELRTSPHCLDQNDRFLRRIHRQGPRSGAKPLGQPLIVYIHPREIDPGHPRLPLALRRRFKCYVHLNSMMSKLEWLCQNYSFCTMLEMIHSYIKSFYLESKTLPVINLEDARLPSESPSEEEKWAAHIGSETLRNKLLLVERAMANFLSPSVLHSHKAVHD